MTPVTPMAKVRASAMRAPVAAPLIPLGLSGRSSHRDAALPAQPQPPKPERLLLSRPGGGGCYVIPRNTGVSNPARFGMVRHSEVKPEQIDDRAD